MQENLALQEIPAMTQVPLASYRSAMDSIHTRIKAARESKKLSMEQLALELGVSWQTIQQWENGKTAPQRKRLARVAELLDTSLQHLVSGLPIENSSAQAVSNAPGEWPFKISYESYLLMSTSDKKKLNHIVVGYIQDSLPEEKRKAS